MLHRHSKRNRGVTIFEVLVTFILIGIISLITVPATVELYRSYERMGAKGLLSSDIVRASSRAATLGTRVVLSITSGGSAYTVGPDYRPYALPAAAETIESSRSLPRTIKLDPLSSLIFDSRGFLVDSNGSPTQANLVLSQNGQAFTNVLVTAASIVVFN